MLSQPQSVLAHQIPVSHEYDFGLQVNHAVQGGNSDTFRMLLAMLSDDVCDQPQFTHLKKQSSQKESDLKARFELSDSDRLYRNESQDDAVRLTNALLQGDMAHVRLLQCLQPEPLSDREAEASVAERVGGLLSPWQQYKLEGNPPALSPADWQQADRALLAVAAAA